MLQSNALQSVSIGKNESIVDNIIQHFKQELLVGKIKAGERLPSEPDLCAKFGVSRSSLREAIKILDALGVVEVRRGDGTYISQGSNYAKLIEPMALSLLLEPHSSNELFETRYMFEAASTKIAAKNATARDIEEMRLAIGEMEQYYAQGGNDGDELAALDLLYHRTVLDATHNPLIFRIGSILNSMIFESIKKTNLLQDGVAKTIEAHKAHFAAIVSRDPQKIDEVVSQNMQIWQDGMKNT
ncbi:MAG: FadR family transcriptional regulator [Anaerolineae bacterium]|nr:FadR family transcriptional regulator [Anaerolineae bacterium]